MFNAGKTKIYKLLQVVQLHLKIERSFSWVQSLCEVPGASEDLLEFLQRMRFLVINNICYDYFRWALVLIN